MDEQSILFELLYSGRKMFSDKIKAVLCAPANGNTAKY